MSTKSSSLSASDSSPEESSQYLTPSFIRDREDKGWRAYFSNTDLMSHTSGIFNHISTEEAMSNQAGFLYDYYGMTEETRLDPPSPGHSSNDDKDHVISAGIDIPGREDLDSPIMEMRHSTTDNGKGSMPYLVSSQSNEQPNLLRRSASTSPSIPSLNRDKITPLSVSAPSPASSISSTTEEEVNQKNSYNYVQKTGFSPQDKYIFILEAQTSIVQKRGAESLTYLNKGQFYYLVFESQPSKHTRVKTIMHLVFGNEKDPASELDHWKYWYNQQPNPNQRAFDIDIKSSQMIDEEIEEVGYNALAFTWNPSVRAKISFRINCLSTDFSAQKGVKGIPLHLQIDTYEDLGSDAEPVHRAFCQIKVFRDKGAERKNKDESKIFGKKMGKFLKGSENSQADITSVFQMSNKVTVLYSQTLITTKSVVFCPKKEKNSPPRRDYIQNAVIDSSNSGKLLNAIKERENKRGFTSALSNAKDVLEHLDVYPKQKAQKVIRRKEPAVTIYVRKEEEKAYNALMLDTPTLEELKSQISRKYGVPMEMITNVFKKTKKGILVNMDDQLIEQFGDEDDFLITIDFDNQLGHFEVIFNC